MPLSPFGADPINDWLLEWQERQRAAFEETERRTDDQWRALSEDCQSGLQTAMTGPEGANVARIGALNQALAAAPQLQAAVAGTNIPWQMLAAIGIRESGFRNVAQPDGRGMGIFQIDLGAHPQVTAQQASDMTWAARFAANLLSTNMARLRQNHRNLNPAQLLQATAASYNLGVGGISGNPNTIDAGSPRNNYGSSVVNVMDCFRN
jgi:hypothetical protein